MIPPHTHAQRRTALARELDGPVLLLGMGRRSRNLPMNEVPFRQDSTFLYFTGCTLPDACAWIEEGRTTLYVPEPAEDDDLWHGHVASLHDLAERYGVDAVEPIERLPARATGSRAKTLAIADTRVNALAASWLGTSLQLLEAPGDEALIDAVIRMRRTKSAEEIAALQRAADLTARAHVLTMRATRPGVHERALAALFDACLASHDAVPGYETILTQRGEVLHNHAHDRTCTAGALLLLDGGAEERSTGYGADVTRTWPVSGRFDGRQQAAYEAVLEAQRVAIAACHPGTRYRAVHDAACLVLARFLVDEGLLKGLTPEQAVERGAHALFFPHGVGHLLGLDVHDLESFGDRPAYPPGVGRPEAFGTRYLRLDLPLEAGWVVTIEPGFYVVPAILGNSALRDRFHGVVDWERAASWEGFGGIRIEDDIVVTDHGPHVLSSAAPKDVAALEALIGSGASLEELLT